jgi:hypothetical protein
MSDKRHKSPPLSAMVWFGKITKKLLLVLTSLQLIPNMERKTKHTIEKSIKKLKGNNQVLTADSQNFKEKN